MHVIFYLAAVASLAAAAIAGVVGTHDYLSPAYGNPAPWMMLVVAAGLFVGALVWLAIGVIVQRLTEIADQLGARPLPPGPAFD